MTRSINIPLFYPYINEDIRRATHEALGQKIIGQGDAVDEFEQKLAPILGSKHILTVNNGTAALELAYHLLDLRPGDEVITPVFTCTATNIPLIRRGVKIVFADVKNNLLMDWDDAKSKITKKTKAIVNAHLFGLYNKNPKVDIPIIGDSAQYLDKTKNEYFTIYSFQATKIINTVDGGALVCKYKKDYKRAKLLRWYGINRETGKDNIEVDIKEAGYKYHMNNVTAAMGIAALKSLNKLRAHRTQLQNRYKKILGTEGGSPFLIHTNNREKLIKKLSQAGIESGLVHRRNDIYSIFGGKRQALPNMNKLEKTYLFLPAHNHMTLSDVEYISDIVKKYR